MSTDLTGERLGHYLVQSVLGQGGMSTVYRAVDERLDRPVALKVISENLSADAEFRERFVEEARAASAIDHVNVVPLYDFGEAGNWLYIAMRLVDGTDLAREVAKGALGHRRVLDLLGQVGEALDMLHERGLVHLDVKPANVLITRNESIGREHVYVADFGLTRRGASGHRTASGDFLGSPTYASPEHLRGDPVAPASDEYSLTCVLFTCLAGRAPFVGTVKEVVSGHLRGQVPSLSAITGLPSAIDRVIARGMAADPTLRYADSGELLGSARRALSDFSDEPIGRTTAPVGGAGAAVTPAAPPVGDDRNDDEQGVTLGGYDERSGTGPETEYDADRPAAPIGDGQSGSGSGPGVGSGAVDSGADGHGAGGRGASAGDGIPPTVPGFGVTSEPAADAGSAGPGSSDSGSAGPGSSGSDLGDTTVAAGYIADNSRDNRGATTGGNGGDYNGNGYGNDADTGPQPIIGRSVTDDPPERRPLSPQPPLNAGPGAAFAPGPGVGPDQGHRPDATGYGSDAGYGPDAGHHQGSGQQGVGGSYGDRFGSDRGPGGSDHRPGGSGRGPGGSGVIPPGGDGPGARHRAPGPRAAWPWLAGAAVLLIAVVVVLIVVFTGGDDPAPVQQPGNPGGQSPGVSAPASSESVPATTEPATGGTQPSGTVGRSDSPATTTAPPTTAGGSGAGLPTLLNPSQITELTSINAPVLTRSR